MARISSYLRDNVLGLVAIFLALSAGAYAVQKAPKNSVVSKSIRDGQVKAPDLAADSVDSTKVVDNSLTGADIEESSLNVPGDGNSGGTVKSITAGKGLDGGIITDQGTVQLHTCPIDQVLKSTGSDYACADDVDTDTNTTYSGNTAAGVQLNGTAFGLKDCPAGQLLKSTGPGAYSCAPDIDTDDDTTYTAGTGLQLNGTTFSIPNGGVGSAEIADDSITAADLGFVRSYDELGGAVGAGTCVGATISQTLQFAPGAPGDYTLMSTDPAMPRGFVLEGKVGPVVGNARQYFLDICNLTGSLNNIPPATVRMLVISH